MQARPSEAVSLGDRFRDQRNIVVLENVLCCCRGGGVGRLDFVKHHFNCRHRHGYLVSIHRHFQLVPIQLC
jgi:hypothetical protein